VGEGDGWAAGRGVDGACGLGLAAGVGVAGFCCARLIVIKVKMSASDCKRRTFGVSSSGVLEKICGGDWFDEANAV
jgi:hypothetical protein